MLHLMQINNIRP